MQVLITCLASADSTAWARPQRRAGHGSRRGSTAAALQTPRPRVAALTATGAAATSSTTSEMSQRDPLDKIVRDEPVGGRPRKNRRRLRPHHPTPRTDAGGEMAVEPECLR